MSLFSNHFFVTEANILRSIILLRILLETTLLWSLLHNALGVDFSVVLLQYMTPLHCSCPPLGAPFYSLLEVSCVLDKHSP